MRIPVSIFDFAAYTVPGVLYLAWLLLIAETTQLVPDLWPWLQEPSLVHIAGGLLVSYLLGHATYSLSKYRLPWERRTTAVARETFRARNPHVALRPFIEADIFLLMAAIEAHNALWATSIASTHATSLMCRNSATALFGIAATVGTHAALTHPPQLPLTWLAIALAVFALLLRHAGRERAVWAWIKTLECAAWITGVDSLFSAPAMLPATPTAKHQVTPAKDDKEEGLMIEPS